MKLKTKFRIIMLLLSMLAILIFLSGLISGVMLQQDYEFKKAFADKMGDEKRTCYNQDNTMGYCIEKTLQDCTTLKIEMSKNLYYPPL